MSQTCQMLKTVVSLETMSCQCPRCTIKFVFQLSEYYNTIVCPVCGLTRKGYGIYEFTREPEVYREFTFGNYDFRLIKYRKALFFDFKLQIYDRNSGKLKEIEFNGEVHCVFSNAIMFLYKEVLKDSSIARELKRVFEANDLPTECPVSTATEKVEKNPDYSKISLKKKTLVQSVTLVCQMKGQFNLYELKIRKGKTDPPVYLLTRPNIFLRNEKDWLNITPFKKPNFNAHFGDHENLDEMYKHYRKEIRLGEDENWKDLSKEHKWKELYQLHLLRRANKLPIFYKLHPQLTKEEIEEIKTWNFDKLKHDHFYEGMKKEPNLVYIYEIQDINFETDPYRTPTCCQNVQPFNSHTIVVTLTGRGKTRFAKQGRGKLFTDASGAGLAGFSTANETNIGLLDGASYPAYLDNVHNYKEHILINIIELMESGETYVAKGKAPVRVRTTSPFILHANPPETKNPTVLAQSLINIFKLMNKVAQGPPAKRISQIYFSIDAIPVSGKPFHPNIVEKIKMVYDYIIEEVNKRVGKNIFPNEKTRNFITSPNEAVQIYAKQVEKFLIGSISSGLESWSHQAKYGAQGILGTALKHGINDNLKEIYLGKYSIDKILSDAEEHVKIVCDLNIKCLKNLLDTIGEVPLKDWIYNKYENIKNLNAKAIVLTLAFYVKMNPKAIIDVNTKIPLESLSNYYDEHLPDEHKSKGYSYFSKVIYKIPPNLEKFNRKLGDFGFDLVKLTDALSNQGSTHIVFTKKDIGELRILSKKLFPK